MAGRGGYDDARGVSDRRGGEVVEVLGGDAREASVRQALIRVIEHVRHGAELREEQHSRQREPEAHAALAKRLDHDR